MLAQNSWGMHFFQKGGLGVICAKGCCCASDDDGDKVCLLETLSLCVDGNPIFTFKENDEGVIPRGDVLKKLPTPHKLGGTARREHMFTSLAALTSGVFSSKPNLLRDSNAGDLHY